MSKLLAWHRVEDGRPFRLRDHDPGDTRGQKIDKDEAHALLVGGVEALSLPDPTARLGYFDPPNRLRLVGSVEQLRPYAWPVCQSAFKTDPLSAPKIDPPPRAVCAGSP